MAKQTVLVVKVGMELSSVSAEISSAQILMVLQIALGVDSKANCPSWMVIQKE